MDLKIEILQELEAIKEGFNDAEQTDGYDLANERFHLENAIALVKKLTIPVVVPNGKFCCCETPKTDGWYGDAYMCKCGKPYIED